MPSKKVTNLVDHVAPVVDASSYLVYAQSTSPNRHLTPNTEILMFS